MEADFNVRDTKFSPFRDKAVKERTAWEPGTTDILMDKAARHLG